MADVYVNTTYFNADGSLIKRQPAINVGAPLLAFFETFETVSGDNDADVKRIFKALDPNLIPIAILIATDGITGQTAVDVGLYETNLGAVCDADCFAANLDTSSAADFGFATALDGMDAVAIENYGRKLYEHAGDTAAAHSPAYDLCLTLDTAGSGAATLAVLMIAAKG